MIITDRFNQVWEIVKQGGRWVASNGSQFIPAKSKDEALRLIQS